MRPWGVVMVYLFLSQCTHGFIRTVPFNRYQIALRNLNHNVEETKHLESFTIPALKTLLRDAGLPVSGRKSVLVERLSSHGMPPKGKKRASDSEVISSSATCNQPTTNTKH
jgi:hypothetical protein